MPRGTEYVAVVDGISRRMCCAGCVAVSEAIVASGLSDYYRHRDALPESKREAMPAELQEVGLFDHPDFQKSFVRPLEGGEREASLILEGITCAACVWLNEQHVGRLPGVRTIEVNYATRRARIRWDEGVVRLSEILAAIQAIGYRAYPYDAARSEQIGQKERRSALWRLFVAGFGMMQVMMYALPGYLAGEGEMTADIASLMRWASLVLTVPVVTYSAAPFFQRAWRDVKLRRLGMDVPVALGVGVAFLASCWATLTGEGEVYFDSVAMFVFFLLCGRYLEMLARQRAVRGVEELSKVIPAVSERYLDWPNGDCERVPVVNLSPGDVIRVRPGEVIPADGEVVEGESEVNESLLTGESRPVGKRCGGEVTGGTINITSPLAIRLEHVGDSTRLAAIQHLMERAATERPRVVEAADRVASWFILALLVLSAVTGAYWLAFDPSKALWVCVSVLVVSCPCALSLATPAALTVATDALARMGVLITRGHAIEALAGAQRVVFDKTGTLTLGLMTLTDQRTAAGVDSSWALQLARSLEAGSEHAIATGLGAAESAVDGPGIRVLDRRAVTGQGVEGFWNGERVRIGHANFVWELVNVPMPDELKNDADGAATVVFLGMGARWLAAFQLTDTMRPGATQLVQYLQSRDIAVSIFSGDGRAAVAAVAEQLAVKDYAAGLSPQGKHDAVMAMQEGGRCVVAMVGDGVNDAPVLAKAQVSVAMGAGTALARNQADVVLLNEDLGALKRGIAMAVRTVAVTRQNLWWAFAYNFTAIPLAMAGWVTPWMAGIGMSASSLLVVLNALRLRSRKTDLA